MNETDPSFGSMVDAAAAQIRDRILDLTLAPGKAINAKWLMENLGLSRTPIREALNRLAAEGLIHLEANHGVFVHPLDIDEIRQLMDAYAVAERVSAFHCDFAHPGLVEDVTRMQANQLAAAREHRFLETSLWGASFRLRIAESSGNHHLIEFYRRTVNHVRRLIRLIYAIEARDAALYDRQIALVGRLHEDIEGALRAADRDRLLAVLTDQVQVFRTRIAYVLGRKGDADFPVG